MGTRSKPSRFSQTFLSGALFDDEHGQVPVLIVKEGTVAGVEVD
jgi:hypothetical protein